MSTARKSTTKKAATTKKAVTRKAATKKVATKKSTAIRKTTATKTPARKKATKVVPVRKAAAKKVAAKAPSPLSAEVRAARQYALEQNFGLSSRLRELLDSKRDALQVLVDEKVALARIKDFIQKRWGPKIGPKALEAYIEATFHKPGRAKAGRKP